MLAAACAEAPRAPGLSEASGPGEAGTDTPIVAASPTSVVDPAEFIGLVHPPTPPEVDVFAGSLVRGTPDGPVRPDHIVQEVRAGKHWMLWLSRRERWMRVEEARVPVWRVDDVEPIPLRMPGRRLLTFGCRMGDDR